MSIQDEGTGETEQAPTGEAQPPQVSPTLIEHPCKFGCGFKGNIGKLRSHYISQHREEYYSQKGAATRTTGVMEEGAPAPVTPTTLPSEADMRASISMEGRAALNRYKKVIMELYLNQMPQISPKSRDYVLTVWGMNTTLHDNPQSLWEEMVHGAGIRAESAQRIVKAMFDLEAKFADVLYKAGTTPIIWSGTPQPITPPPMFQGWPQPQAGYPAPPFGYQPHTYPQTSPPGSVPPPAYGQPYPYYHQQQQLTVKDIAETVDRVIREHPALNKPKDEVTEISIPIRDPDTGEPILDGKGQPLFDVVKVPVSQAHLYLGMMRGAGSGKKAPSDETIALQQQLENAQQHLSKLEETLEKEREARTQDKIDNLTRETERTREEISRMQNQLITVQSSTNAYGLVGTIGSKLLEKQPVKEAGDTLLRLGGQPPPKRVEAHAGRSIIERLRPTGYVEERT